MFQSVFGVRGEMINFERFSLRRNNKSGIMMIVVLWILVILSMLAIGLGQRTRVDLALTKHTLGKTRADYLAWAGLTYSINQIRLKGLAEEAQQADSLYACGFKLNDGQTSEKLFGNISLEEGSFTVAYNLNDGEEFTEVCYGFQDEERRVNLNAINSQNYRILSHVIMFLGYSESVADEIALSVVDWRDADSEVSVPLLGAEDEFYGELSNPYRCKNWSFETSEELYLVRGVTEEIYSRIKEYVTIFPVTGSNFVININTASEIVLKSFFRYFAEQNSSIGEESADSLSKKIIAYRSGADQRPCTADDQVIIKSDLEALGLNTSERALALSSMNKIVTASNYFRISIKGNDKIYRILSNAEAVVGREDFSIFYWHKG